MLKNKLENKNEKFKRLASARTNEILKKLKILSNCSNKSVYYYTPKEVDKIFNIIEKSILKSKAQFKMPIKRKDMFKL